MKKTISILLTLSMLILSAPGSAYAVDTLSDPIDQIEPSDEKPDPAEVERTIRAFLRDELNFNEAVTSGILANIYVECKFNPGDSYVESGGFTSYGICQWNRDRLQAMIDYCAALGYKSSDVRGQLAFMKYELETTEISAYRRICSISNDAAGAYEAGYNWARYYERSSSSGHLNRANLARDTYWQIYGKYLPIGLNVPYFTAEGGDTLSAGLAMAEAYLAGYPSGDSRVTEQISELDVKSLYTECAADAGVIFAALQQGIPVILKTGESCALIYGYDGESDVLESTGFRTLIPTPSERIMPGSYGHAIIDSKSTILVRRDLAAALPLNQDGAGALTLSGFAHPAGLNAADSIRLGGRLVSAASITRVEVTLKDADGDVIAQTSASPDATAYDLALLPALVSAGTPAAGDYTLTLSAEDKNGATLIYTDSLTVCGLPTSGRIGESGPDPLSTEEARIPGIYKITAKSGLNVRSGPSTDTSKLTAIPSGETVTVTEITGDGWGKTVYAGKTGWISMQYTAFVSSTNFAVSYHANGGAGAPAADLKLDGVALTLSKTTPTRTGYTFLGWSTDRSAAAADYKSGDSYTDNSGNITLYAVWAEIVPVPGDLNADGAADVKDVQLLQQYLNGFDAAIDYAACDIDGDGVISMRDLAILQSRLNEANG